MGGGDECSKGPGGHRAGRGRTGRCYGLCARRPSLSAWQWVTGLIAATPVLGYVATGLIALLCAVALIIAGRELAGFARLGRLDQVRARAESAIAQKDVAGARRVSDELAALYARRPELRLGLEAVQQARDEGFETEAIFALLEQELMAPLDRDAEAEIEAAARQVATVTALVPIALADVIAALTANMRMIRRIAQINGGRGGTLGARRLTRAVLRHLVATGAVAVGDDLLGSVAGGAVLSKVSRRFGEGMVNGALTARVGIAAMEVCRPMPFGPQRRPSVSDVIRRALSGRFSTGER